MSEVFATLAGKRVLVTGDTGFKGSWLCRWLLQLGADVHGFALPAESPSHFQLLRLTDDMPHTDGDIRNPAEIARVVDSFEPELIIHLAAQALVRRAYADPLLTITTNTLGTAHVLDAARRQPSVQAVVAITSDKCYENVEWPYAYRENDRLGGHDPYSASKAAAEHVISTYARSFFVDAPRPRGLASARAGNVIGGGDFAADRLVPDCARTLLAGATLTLRYPDAVRPWQHVLEPVSGYLLLGARLLAQPQALSQAFNFGPASDTNLTVMDIANAFRARLGSGDIEIESNEHLPREATLLKLACDKARSELGWSPRLRATEALDWTVEWYSAYQSDPSGAARVTDRQIADYGALPGV